MKTDSALSPLLKMIAPMAKKHITPENLSKIYDSLTAKFTPEEGERVVLIISKPKTGAVKGSVVTLDEGSLVMTGILAQADLDELLLQLLENL